MYDATAAFTSESMCPCNYMVPWVVVDDVGDKEMWAYVRWTWSYQAVEDVAVVKPLVL
jgi:hypothetical protein